MSVASRRRRDFCPHASPFPGWLSSEPVSGQVWARLGVVSSSTPAHARLLLHYQHQSHDNRPPPTIPHQFHHSPLYYLSGGAVKVVWLGLHRRVWKLATKHTVSTVQGSGTWKHDARLTDTIPKARDNSSGTLRSGERCWKGVAGDCEQQRKAQRHALVKEAQWRVRFAW